MKVVTTRIEDQYFEDLKKIEKDEHTERAEVMRKLLANGIKDWKTKKALSLLKDHKVTIRKAASIADLSYVEMIDKMAKADIDSGYTLKDLQRDVAR